MQNTFLTNNLFPNSKRDLKLYGIYEMVFQFCFSVNRTYERLDCDLTLRSNPNLRLANTVQCISQLALVDSPPIHSNYY